MRCGVGFMHLYNFYYLYVFPDNKDVNTEKYRNITVHCFDSGWGQKPGSLGDRLYSKIIAALERFFCIGTSSYLTRFLMCVSKMLALEFQIWVLHLANVFGGYRREGGQDGEGGQVIGGEIVAEHQVGWNAVMLNKKVFSRKVYDDDASVELAFIKVQVTLCGFCPG